MLFQMTSLVCFYYLQLIKVFVSHKFVAKMKGLFEQRMVAVSLNNLFKNILLHILICTRMTELFVQLTK